MVANANVSYIAVWMVLNDFIPTHQKGKLSVCVKIVVCIVFLFKCAYVLKSVYFLDIN